VPLIRCYILRSKDYIFRPVVAIIMSLSFDIFKIILYNCAAAQLYKIILNISNDKDLMMATIGRNM